MINLDFEFAYNITHYATGHPIFFFSNTRVSCNKNIYFVLFKKLYPVLSIALLNINLYSVMMLNEF